MSKIYSDLVDAAINFAPGLVAVLGGFFALASMVFFVTNGRVGIGKFGFNSEKKVNEWIKENIAEYIAQGSSPQIALMQEYHEQGLSQSKISFWFSLVFASLGFAIIASAVVIFLQGTGSQGTLESAGKPIFTLVAGTVIDAVAALFFVQSNKARQLMTEFFDKLRVDRKLDEDLALMKGLKDPIISSRIQGIVALHFSDVPLDKVLLSETFTTEPKPPATPATPV